MNARHFFGIAALAAVLGLWLWQRGRQKPAPAPAPVPQEVLNRGKADPFPAEPGK
jgi:hypothetical protein